MNTLTNLRAFSLRIVREYLAIFFGSGNGVMIRGDTFELSSILINSELRMYKCCVPCEKVYAILYALVQKKPIDFGRLAYDQILDTAGQSNGRQPIGFPNLIHEVLVHQCAIRPLVGDGELIGRPMYLWRMREASGPLDVSPQ
ncbi:unnamed protein product [Brassica oleracea var. botrytis]|uniref:Uncharacterized protein n=1 Tax=Brassica oleracea TaxID=3712 RepID=A0A3P6D0F6_BRAOL|nr:unnamed protein product [Brassica oleracea]